MKFPDNEKAMCMRVDSLLPSTNELPWDLVIEEPLERCLTKSLLITELESEQVSSILYIGESILVLDESEEENIVIEDQKTINGLTLKELPKHLRYAFLGENDKTANNLCSFDRGYGTQAIRSAEEKYGGICMVN